GLIKEQIRKVLADLPVSHIKTGMIGTGAVARAIGECLADFEGTVICDPVLKASDGHDLLNNEGLACLGAHIIGRATVLTPNYPEFQVLTGLDSDSAEAIASAAAGMFGQYQRLQAIIVKGGHRDETQPLVIDSLFIRDGGDCQAIISERARIRTANTHGTGCTYASALAAYHLKTNDWPQAFQLAGDYVAALLRLSADRKMGRGTGPLWHHLFKERNDC
ncbi:MAG: bifunctional hydroxymethylpyrimidine kinase/phosphomethylpyrimidine kinase, partial [Desulfobulbaceae bacterium]|nr:bifunctional hydroxymethylpyrimidine kinase/phosphomethylpyrimidine kinase [Desulfobulbaceae bacterium]